MVDILSAIFAISVILIILSLKKRSSNKKLLLVSVIACIISFIGIYNQEPINENENLNESKENINQVLNENLSYELSNIPDYKDVPYVNINNGIPFFTESDLVTTSYEKYSELDSLRKMRHNNCLYRKRFNANGRKRKYRKRKTNWLANCKI